MLTAKSWLHPFEFSLIPRTTVPRLGYKFAEHETVDGTALKETEGRRGSDETGQGSQGLIAVSAYREHPVRYAFRATTGTPHQGPPRFVRAGQVLWKQECFLVVI
jgi:hypothetical protein